MKPVVGFYGDDFTGSVDALLQYRRAGLSGVLFTGTDGLTTLDVPAEVVGIAGTARSLATEDMEREVGPALAALHTLAPRVVQYKACSTADSSPRVGSLGRAIELGRAAFGDQPVPVLLAQPDFGRYTAFGNHFAREGESIYRLDRQPTMSRHPVTPIDEADLVEFLGRQTDLRIQRVDFVDYHGSGAEAGSLLDRFAQRPEVVVLDALDDNHLAWVGRALLGLSAEPLFALGSGGLSRALGLALSTEAVQSQTTVEPAEGAVLVISGSCSPRTWAQVENAAGAGWTVIDPLTHPGPEDAVRKAIASGTSVVACTSSPGGVREDDGRVVAGALSALVEAGSDLPGLSRVVVAGGDTSGRVLRLLGIASIAVAATPWGNAPLLRVTSGRPELDRLEWVLKGGQMGPVDLFERIRTGRSLPVS